MPAPTKLKKTIERGANQVFSADSITRLYTESNFLRAGMEETNKKINVIKAKALIEEELKANGLLTELKIGRQSYYHLSDAGQSVYDAFKHYIPTSNIAMANGIPANVKTRIFGRYARSEKLTASILSVGGSLVITIQLFYEHLTAPNIPLYVALPFTMLIGGFVGGLAALHMHYAKRYEKAAEGVQDAAGLQTVHADRL